MSASAISVMQGLLLFRGLRTDCIEKHNLHRIPTTIGTVTCMAVAYSARHWYILHLEWLDSRADIWYGWI